MFAPQLPAQQLLAHATQLHRAGNFASAVEVYRQLLRNFPNNAEILDKLGAALAALGQTEEARRHIERAIKISPQEPIFHHDLHLTYKREGRWAKAEECLDKALRLSPRNPVFTAAKAELALMQGDADRALRTIEPIRSQAGEVAPVALVWASLAPRIGGERDAAESLRRLLSRQEITGSTRAKASFALGFALDYAGDHDGAFEAYRAANTAIGQPWDPEAHSRTIDEAIAAWTRDAAAASERAEVDGSGVVLIVGMPRSGQGLVTQMLAGLPGSEIGGEFNDLLLAARDLQGPGGSGAPIFTKPSTLTRIGLTDRAKAYLSKLSQLRPKATLVSDRLPMNLLNLGLISRMLPGVRVINCNRDRMDSGMACYAQLFVANFPFAYDLGHLGRFIRDLDRLTAHWKSTLDLPIHDVTYEDLLQKPEAVARGIAEFVGREWSDKALEPARKWVQTVTLPDGSMRDLVPDGRIGLARDYDKHLGALREAMG